MTEKVKRPVGVVGAGAVGTTLAYLLAKKGHPLTGIASRRMSSADKAAAFIGCRGWDDVATVTRDAEVVILAVPDRAVQDVCREIISGTGFHIGQVVMHTSGALPADALMLAKEYSTYVLSFHPLHRFTDPQTSVRTLAGASIILEGDAFAMPIGHQLAQDLGCVPVVIEPRWKALYHAGACIGAHHELNHGAVALDLFLRSGLGEEPARHALAHLEASVAESVARLGPARALAGPAARGDAVTVKAHVSALATYAPEHLDLYRRLGRAALALASERGLAPALADEVAAALETVVEPAP